MDKAFEVIRSRRRSISIEIKRDLRIIIRAPLKMRQSAIEKFVEEHTLWIEKHIEIAKERLELSKKASAVCFTAEELKILKAKARNVIPEKVKAYAEKMGVTYGRIAIRCQITRWGSCSDNGNLNFNCLLSLCPDAVVEYVVIHELCHRKHMNHSAAFWQMVAEYYPNYKLHKKWLKENGGNLVSRLPRR